MHPCGSVNHEWFDDGKPNEPQDPVMDGEENWSEWPVGAIARVLLLVLLFQRSESLTVVKLRRSETCSNDIA
jgi:hypothetical protein